MTEDRKRYYGIYRGKVHSNLDPSGRKRLKLTIPQVLGSHITGWVDACFPPAVLYNHGDSHEATTTTSLDPDETHTHEVTLLAHVGIPDIGSVVFVMFESGDPDYPVWIGMTL